MELTFLTLQEWNWPLTSAGSIAIALTLYLATIFSLKEFMKTREKFELKAIVPLHNFFLSALSLVMLLGVAYHVFRIVLTSDHIINDLFCDTDRRMANGNQTYWFYIFYLSKFYELLDTPIIILKKRPLIFLHVYHHIITIVLVYVMMVGEVAARWLPTVANASVHVPMYYYYGIASLGMTAWWKKYLTKMQIGQFIVDISGNLSYLYFYIKGDTCSSGLTNFFFGQGIILSFLILFISFFKKTYTSKNDESGTSTEIKSTVVTKKIDGVNMKLRRVPDDIISETRKGE